MTGDKRDGRIGILSVRTGMWSVETDKYLDCDDLGDIWAQACEYWRYKESEVI